MAEKELKTITFVNSKDTYKIVDEEARANIQGLSDKLNEYDFTEYYTKEQVNIKVKAAIASAQLEGSEVDLSGYYNKIEVDEAIANATPEIDHSTFSVGAVDDGEGHVILRIK